VVRAARSTLSRALLATLLLWTCASAAHAGGRWFAWVDRVPEARETTARAALAARGLAVEVRPSGRFVGQEPGFVHLVARESLFRAEAQEAVEALQARGFKQAGLQYFSDVVPEAVQAALGGVEPVFSVDLDIDGQAPDEHVALIRDDAGDRLVVLKRHIDGTIDVAVEHVVALRDLPRVTEGERAQVFPLGPKSGRAVVFQAAFPDRLQESLWSFVFTFSHNELKRPPGVYFVPGARAPIPARVDFRVGQTGLGWRVEVSGLVDGQRRVREMLWNGATFVDARGWPQ